PDLDSVYGAYSARLTGPGTLWFITLTDQPIGPHRTELYYRTDATSTLPLVISGTGSPDVDVTLPSVASGTPLPVDYDLSSTAVSVRFEAAGTAWIDEVHTYQSPGMPTYDYGLPSSYEQLWSFSGRARTTEAVRYWDSIVDDKVTVLRDAGRK